MSNVRVRFHKDFTKGFARLPKNIQQRFHERLELFLVDVSHPLLNVHHLRGEEWPLMSMNVTGDYRALFLKQSKDIVFLRIGTHSQLYGE
jgi:mRNA-degrading endonuclease YafQ of YafQ-DinJ toxin-antitoxin module